MAPPLQPAAKRIGKILRALDQAYPDAACSLAFSTPLELLVATILSAQCTDALVNQVTQDLFRRYTTAAAYATADLAALERDIARVNFYRNKARSIQQACRILVDRFGGAVPDRMDDLIQLPGVARKTANVVLGNAFHIQAGVVVDTHVMRVSQRLGLTTPRLPRHRRGRSGSSRASGASRGTRQTDRDKIERDLMALVPRTRWTRFGHRMILHGRAVCQARAPRCRVCPIGRALCPSYHA